MLGCIGESFSLKSFSTHSLCLYFVFMLVRAENPLSHRYVVAKGIKVVSILGQKTPVVYFSNGHVSFLNVCARMKASYSCEIVLLHI